jgi:hypothetical protein
MYKYVVRTRRMQQIRRLLAFKSGSDTVQIDFSPWAEENGAVTAVSWTVESGQAGVSDKTLSSNVAEALITTSEVGGTVIKLVATAGNIEYPLYLDVYTKDPKRYVNDYGLVFG